MPFSLNALQKHIEKRKIVIYGQPLNYGFYPSTLTRPLTNRIIELEELDKVAEEEYQAALEDWEDRDRQGDKPARTSPALDEMCKITAEIIAEWDVEFNGKPIPLDGVREYVETGAIPLNVLFEIFGDAVRGGREAPKSGNRRRR